LAAKVALQRPVGYPVRMTRRRLNLAACVAVVALVVAWWWLLSSPLTAEEQRFVGAWRLRQNESFLTLTFTADHRCSRSVHYPLGTDVIPGRWWVRGETIFIDLEQSAVRRTLRPLLGRLGIPVVPVGSTDTTIFDFDGTNRRRSAWTRDRED
jgi:hypothetical protein